MALIPTLVAFSPGTVILSADVNSNNTAIRDAFNGTAVLTDVAKTITVSHTISADPGLILTAAVSRIVGGATSFAIRNAANSLDNLLVTDAGAVTFRSTVGGITTLTATTLAGTLSTAAQPNVTSLGTLTGLTLSGTISGVTTLTATTLIATTLTGTLSTAAQPNVTSLGTLSGLTVTAQVTAGAGAGSATLKSAGIINVQTTNVANVGSGETDLMSYTLPANSLDVNGRVVRVTAFGSLTGNTNAKTVTIYWGAVSVGAIQTSALAKTYWRIEMTIVKIGANSQKRFVRGEATETAGANPVVIAEYVTTPAQTDTAGIVIKVTGTGVSNNDIVQTGMLTEFLN